MGTFDLPCCLLDRLANFHPSLSLFSCFLSLEQLEPLQIASRPYQGDLLFKRCLLGMGQAAPVVRVLNGGESREGSDEAGRSLLLSWST